MITTTLAVLVDAQPALERLSALPLPAQTAYALAKLTRLIRPEVEHFVAQRNDLIRAHGAEANGAIEVRPEERDVYIAKVTELALVTVDLDVAPILLAALDGVRVMANDLLALDPFILGDDARPPVLLSLPQGVPNTGGADDNPRPAEG